LLLHSCDDEKRHRDDDDGVIMDDDEKGAAGNTALDRYEILRDEVLGRGSFGTVHAAVDKRTKQKVRIVVVVVAVFARLAPFASAVSSGGCRFA